MKNKNILIVFLIKLLKSIGIISLLIGLFFFAEKSGIYEKSLNTIGYSFGSLCLLIGVWKFMHSNSKTEKRFFSIIFIIFGCIWIAESLQGLFFPFPTLVHLVLGVIVSTWLGFGIILILFLNYFEEEDVKINIFIFSLFFIFIGLYILNILRSY